MTLGMFCLSVNDITYKNLSFNFPVWEQFFLELLRDQLFLFF